ncbi:DUF6276 family protein [Halopenitus persicus]|uniref:Small CPxCG-related zinc finger protein n=1 Tax=Halopenitus persicus TaxID=1048396 RepID=A0A1H3G3I4_9EURY|nr:DUF6276 family protein [Halopenitus persicus]SDX96994.1 hypothetical protein SAMN05216564_102291 [Halopenitus persicus]
MSCPDCGSDRVALRVPVDLRDHAGSETVAVCRGCLRVQPADADTADPGTPADVDEAIPDGEGGVAFLLACGKLGSLALNRSAIVELFEYAEDAGVDVYLTLDRLAETVQKPHFDVSRRLEQVDEFL